MADIAPFKGLRYNLKKVSSLTKVVAPPYDVINEEYREKLAAREAHNCVHLILPQEAPGKDRYAVAAALLKRWAGEGALVEDSKPAIYVIEQEWTTRVSRTPSGPRDEGARHVRTGFIAAVRLERFGEGKIYPHENTLSAPKEDRLKLLKATRANLSQVFGLFPDDTRDVGAWLARVTARPAAAQASDDAGVVTRLWVESDSERVESLTKSMADRPIFIADGHHRYETALNYRQWLAEQSAKGTGRPENSTGAPENSTGRPQNSTSTPQISTFLPVDGVMMLCVAMSDPGLLTQPTHRLLPKSVVAPDILIERLKQEFSVHPFATFSGSAGEVDRELISDVTPNLMILYVGNGRPPLKICPRDSAGILANMANLSIDWRFLDVSILQYAVLERLLGLTLDHVTRGAMIGYEHDADEAIRRVDSGEFASAFILRPTPVSAVAKVASRLEKMPPKSTYFYPKALTGIVIRGLWQGVES